MVKKFLVGLGVVGAIFTITGTASAATTTVDVSANIVGTCQFNTTPTLAFGTLDQTLATDATASGDLTFWCTKNASYTLSDPDGATGTYSSGVITNASSDTIPYSIDYSNNSGSGAGKTAPVTSTLSATILNGDYVDAPAGSYTGTVVFTITP